ncbi:MAG: PaaI family thioesterase [Acidimicrobiales bacterium]
MSEPDAVSPDAVSPDPVSIDAVSIDPQRLREGLAEARAQQVGERHAAAVRAGVSVRSVIEALVSSNAPAGALEAIADRLDEVVAALRAHPAGREFEGFSEAANAGRSVSFFDWSPLAGLANPLAPPLKMDVVGDEVVATVQFGAPYEGPPGCVHGGYIAAVFDEVLGLTQSLSGRVGMTGTLTVRYRLPTPLRVPLRLVGRLESIEGRKVFTSGTMEADGRVTAEAEGLFISVSPERFEALANHRRLGEPPPPG